MTMIFAPVNAERLDHLIGAGSLDQTPAFTATQALRDDLGLGPGDDEDADFAAFRYACVRAICDASPGRGGTRRGRIVVAADVPQRDVHDSSDRLGRVSVDRIRWRDVTAVYLDEDSAAESLASARGVVEASADVGAAADAPEVARVLEEHAMLWHLPAEVAD